jgi:hypothetical protein
MSSKYPKNNNNDKNNPTDAQELTGSLHIRAFRNSEQPSALGTFKPDQMVE